MKKLLVTTVAFTALFGGAAFALEYQAVSKAQTSTKDGVTTTTSTTVVGPVPNTSCLANPPVIECGTARSVVPSSTPGIPIVLPFRR